MRLKSLWIDGFKNLHDFKIDFENRDGITVLIGNNASGKSNILEAISAIFAGLYNNTLETLDFELDLVYSINDLDIRVSKKQEIRYRTKKTIAKTWNKSDKLRNEYIPSQVIALYSGEDLRLWRKYYKTFYSKFKRNILKKNAPMKQNMFYVDGRYWDIALLTFLYSSLPNLQDFVSDIFQGRKVKDIILNLNIKNYQKHNDKANINYLITFLKELTKKNSVIDIHSDVFNLDIDQFGSASLGFEKEFFINLSTANALNKPSTKLINKIVIILEDGSIADDLSEGQKKQILLKLSLEVLADENSLLLFDEPDAHIHINNKKIIPEMLKDYENREIILTTHSPTLAYGFDTKHLAYVDNGKINEKYNTQEKLLNDLTNGLMGVSEQQILLQSNKDILIVEGKTDEAYISAALEVLKKDNKKNNKKNNKKYKDLNFNFLWLGGTDADTLNKIIQEFNPKQGQTIIAFFDRDDAGSQCIEKVLKKKIAKESFNGELKNGIHIYFYPKKTGFTQSNFEMEDYFPIEVLQEFIYKESKAFQDLKGKFNNKKKVEFSNKCKEKKFNKKNFNGFKVLFDLILKIKNPLIKPAIQTKITKSHQKPQLRKQSKDLLELAKAKVEQEIER